jgi:aryl-alcohol dehydrogenase-like predicted oxidoreductase
MSLERLKTDYIDIYLLHIPNNTLDIDEIIHTLNILKKK